MAGTQRPCGFRLFGKPKRGLAGRRGDQYRALFLDEPIASLDPRHQLLLLRAVRNLSREDELAVMVVLHDVNLAGQWCDRLLLLSDGRAVAHGTPAEVLTPQTLEKVYGLPARVVRGDAPAVTFWLPADPG